MTVATFDQPDSTTMDAATYKAAIDAAIAVLANLAGGFAPHESAIPDMRVTLDAGKLQYGITLISHAQQTTGFIPAPAAGNRRIDRMVIDEATGDHSVIYGVEVLLANTASAPAIPSGQIAICQYELLDTTTAITNSMITDERALFSQTGLLQKVIDIGDWDMSAATGSSSVSVAHGLTLSKIRSISALVRDDLDSQYYDIKWDNGGGTGASGAYATSTNIVLNREVGGAFDNVNYNATSYNRGWITIQYTN